MLRQIVVVASLLSVLARAQAYEVALQEDMEESVQLKLTDLASSDLELGYDSHLGVSFLSPPL